MTETESFRSVQTERSYEHEPNDGDPRISAFIKALGESNRFVIEQCILEAGNDLGMLRRFLTINTCAMGQLEIAKECLKIAQLEARAWKNITGGCRTGGTTKAAKRKIDKGERQLLEVHEAKTKLGEDWIEYT